MNIEDIMEALDDIDNLDTEKKDKQITETAKALKEINKISDELNKISIDSRLTVEEEIEFDEKTKPKFDEYYPEKVAYEKEYKPVETKTEINNSFTSMTDDEKKIFLEILKASQVKAEKETKGAKYDFRQIRDIIPIEEWINDSYYVPFTKYIYPYWKSYVIDIFKGQEGKNFELPFNEVVVGGCFSGNTEVYCYEYGDTTFEKLSEYYKNGCTITINSWNEEKGILEKVNPKDVCKRLINQKMLRITLSNYYSYECTLDHKHKTPNYGYIEAYKLNVGDEVFSPYKQNDILKNHYKIIKIEELEELKDAYCLETEHNNFMLSGGIIVSNSIGIGKSTLATILVMRMIYILSCFENIQTFYGLMPGSPLYICIISVNREVAEATLYGDLLNKIDMTPYFEDKFPRNKRISSLISFPNDLTIIFGSNTNSVIGKNVICFAADEMGFRSGDLENTNKFYNYLLARNKSRFIYGGGKNGSLAILMSSATTSTSIVEQRKKEALINPKITARDPSLWEVKPNAYSKNRFPLFTGSSTTEPCIVDTYEKLKKILVEENVHIDEENFKVVNNPQEEYNSILNIREHLPDYISKAIISVPVELKIDFENNLIDSMMNLAGVAVSPSGRLFTSKRLYSEAIDEDIYTPFKKSTIMLSTGDNVGIIDYIKSYLIPSDKTDLSIPRFIHIDGSFAGDTDRREGDHSGISMCHITGVRVLPSGAKLPLIKIDFILEIESPKAPNQTSLEKVLDIVFTLQNHLKYNIKGGAVTYDGFQSQYAIQLLEKNGFKSYVLSVDRTDGPYLDLVNMFYEKRLKFKDHPKFKKEIFELIHYRDGGKVDHPADGSKDVSDSVCGCIQSAIRSEYFKNNYLEVIEQHFVDSDEYLRKLDMDIKTQTLKNKDVSDLFIDEFINTKLIRR